MKGDSQFPKTLICDLSGFGRKRRIHLADLAFPADCHPVTSKRGENFMVANLKGAFGGADLEVKEEDDATAEAAEAVAA
jgi:hypothetical protein